jgi:hypothetical protein
MLHGRFYRGVASQSNIQPDHHSLVDKALHLEHRPSGFDPRYGLRMINPACAPSTLCLQEFRAWSCIVVSGFMCPCAV